MKKDFSSPAQMEERIDLLQEELDETYRSILELTNEIDIANAQRLKAESEQLHLQKLESLGLMAGGIAHDFNNLLLIILGNCEMAQMSIPEDNAARECITSILKAANRAAELTARILDYSGRGTVGLETLDLNELVDETREIINEYLVKSGIQTAFRLRHNLPEIIGSVKQLRQLIMILISNAAEALAKADSEEARITISTGIRDYGSSDEFFDFTCRKPIHGVYVFLEIKDNGCGIESHLLPKLCDPFFTTKFIGQGLGLSAAAGIIKGHEGALLVASEPGQGSIFTVLFPPRRDRKEISLSD